MVKSDLPVLLKIINVDEEVALPLGDSNAMAGEYEVSCLSGGVLWCGCGVCCCGIGVDQPSEKWSTNISSQCGRRAWIFRCYRSAGCSKRGIWRPTTSIWTDRCERGGICIGGSQTVLCLSMRLLGRRHERLGWPASLQDMRDNADACGMSRLDVCGKGRCQQTKSRKVQLYQINREKAKGSRPIAFLRVFGGEECLVSFVERPLGVI